MNISLITVLSLIDQLEGYGFYPTQTLFWPWSNDIMIKVRVYSFHTSCGIGTKRTGKMDFDNQSTILKITNHTYNFIKQQCQPAGLRRANRSLSVKSQLGISGI